MAESCLVALDVINYWASDADGDLVREVLLSSQTDKHWMLLPLPLYYSVKNDLCDCSASSLDSTIPLHRHRHRHVLCICAYVVCMCGIMFFSPLVSHA